MKSKRSKNICILFMLLISISTDVIAQQYNKHEEAYAKAGQGYNELIKKLNIPVMEIDIDKTTAKPLVPKIIIDSDKEISKEKYFLAYVRSIIAHKDTLFIHDIHQNAIFISNYNGKIIKSIGREGRGPGEFKYPQYMSENKDYFFVYDIGNGRIQIFNKKLKYLKSLPAQFTPSGRNIGANKDYLILNEKIGVPFDITSYSLKDLSLKKSDLIDKNFVFNVDLQRANYTYGMQIDASSDNYIVAAVSMHPYIFVFDNNGKPLYSLKYKSKKITELMRTNASGSFHTLVFRIKVISNQLFVLIPGEVIIIDLQKKAINKVYSLVNTEAFTFDIFKNTLFTATLNKICKVDIDY